MRVFALILLAMLTAACGQRMIDQEKQETWEEETAALGRHPPDGTVARGEIARLQVLANRPEMTPALIARGRVVYDRVCALCHGRTGRGDGIIVARGFPPPPSYHADRLRDMAPSYVVEVITNGYGVMYPYANRVEPEDRWAVAAYVQALQRLGAQVEPVAPDARPGAPPAFKSLRAVKAPSPPPGGGEDGGEGEGPRPHAFVPDVASAEQDTAARRAWPHRTRSPSSSPPCPWGRGGVDAAPCSARNAGEPAP